jgi:hypothetical protein
LRCGLNFHKQRSQSAPAEDQVSEGIVSALSSPAAPIRKLRTCEKIRKRRP